MERILKKLAELEESFDPQFYLKSMYKQPVEMMKLAVFGLLKLSTSEISDFVRNLNPISVDFFAGQKPYFILEFKYERALEILDAFNGKKMLFKNKKCIVYIIPLNPTFSPDLPRRPLIGDLAISNSIPGLEYTHNYLSKFSQESILTILESLDWSETLNRRKVIHFGYKFDYTTSTVSKDPRIPIPSWLEKLLKDLEPRFDQITINRYEPGDGIASHVDTHSSFMDTMYIISLGSDIIMEFRNEVNEVDVLLKAGSCLKITGETRYGYEHGIKPRKVDVVDGMIQDRGVRYSITIRETRGDIPCKCAFKEKCY